MRSTPMKKITTLLITSALSVALTGERTPVWL
jgi:hypothetical protein